MQTVISSPCRAYPPDSPHAQAGMTSLTATFAASSTTIPLSVEATFLPGWPQVRREAPHSFLGGAPHPVNMSPDPITMKRWADDWLN